MPKTAPGDERQRFIIVVPFNEMIDWDKVSSEFRDPLTKSSLDGVEADYISPWERPFGLSGDD